MNSENEMEYLDEDSFADDSLPIDVDEDAVPIELTETFPWHKPRKQFVRQRQWVSFSKKLLKRLLDKGDIKKQRSESLPEVRYLTLPGSDYIDVRMLAEVCHELGAELTSTGFLAGDEGTPVMARARLREESLREAGYITTESHTLPRKLEETSSESAQAYRELRRRGPFHIVNIDACGSLALPRARGGDRLIDAIYRIVEYQIEQMNCRWALFLTTDATVETVSDELIDQLTNEILKNAEQCEDFDSNAKTLFEAQNDGLESALNEVSKLRGRPFIEFISVGVSKWLLHLAEGKGWSIKMNNSYYYSTTPQNDPYPSMPCLAYEFLPPAPGLVDPASIVNVQPRQGGIELDSSNRVLEKVSEMMDLDELMARDGSTRDELFLQTKTLLTEIGYTEKSIETLREN